MEKKHHYSGQPDLILIIQAGIVSWGIGCGSDSPAVYAKVAKASCWIDYEVIFATFYKDKDKDIKR